MTSGVEAIGFLVRDICIHNHDTDEPGSSVEDLDTQSHWFGTHARVHEGAGLDVASSEGEGDFRDGVDMGQEIGDNVHLGDALHLDFAAVLTPLFVREMAINGAFHVSC